MTGNLQVQPLQNQGTLVSPQPSANAASSTSQLDPLAVAMTKAIRKTESNGNFSAEGKSGEYGAYQFTQGTWNSAAQKYLGYQVPLSEATPEQQNEVAYKRIKDWKDQGYSPGQIASMWNAGSGEPNAYQGTFSNGNMSIGVNKYGVHYSVPDYAKKVATAYQSFKGDTFNPTPFSSPGQFDFTGLSKPAQTDTPKQLPTVRQELLPVTTKDFWTGLGGDLVNRGKQIGQSVKDAFTGKIGIGSGILQTAGGIAGGLGDIVNKGLEIIPGVKLAEDEIGLGVGALAKTDAGQSVIKHLNDFSTAHPELAGDMNASFNIITAIPILKGLSAVKSAVLDASSQALKTAAERAATRDLTEVVSRTVGGREALQAVPEGLQTLVERRALPEIITEGGVARYSTQSAGKSLSRAISGIDDELTTELKKANLPEVSSRLPLATVRKEAVAIAENELKDPTPIEKVFDRIQKKFGDYPTLEQYQDAKRKISRQISEAAFGDPEMTTNKSVRKALQTAVEQGAEKLGLKNVNTINQRMAQLIKSQDLLDAIDGKAVKNTGILHAGIKNVATGAGEVIGQALNLPPLAGGFTGRGIGSILDNTVGKLAKRNMVSNILERTSGEYVRPPLLGKLKNMTLGALGQKATKQ